MIIIIAHTSTRAGVLVCIILSSSAATAGCAITIFPHFLFHFSFLFTMSLSLSLSPFCAAWVSFFSNPKSSIRQSWKRKEKISCPYFLAWRVTLLRTSQMMRERDMRAIFIYLMISIWLCTADEEEESPSDGEGGTHPEKRHKLCIMYTLLLLLNFWVVFSLRALNYSSNKSACAAPHITEAKSKLFSSSSSLYFSTFTVFYDAAMLDKAGQQKAGLP